MADFTKKNYVDIVGLGKFWEKVKAYYDPTTGLLKDYYTISAADAKFETIANVNAGLATKAALSDFNTLSGKFDTVEAKVNGIAAGAQVNVLEAVKVNGTALSITDKAVDIDLRDYAKSADVTAEIAAEIGKMVHIKFEVIEDGKDLPEVGVDGVIYLKKEAGPEGNSYGEYIYVGGKYEKLGTQHVDLTGYATESWVSTQLEPYAKTADVNASIKAVDDKLGGFSSTDTVSAEFVKVRQEIKTLTDLGGEPNSIETVKVNGVALEIVDESVNIDLSAYDKIADRESAVNGVAARVKTLEDADFAGQISAAEGRLNGEIAKKVDQSAYDAKIATLATTAALESAINGLDAEYKAADVALGQRIDGVSTAAGNAQTAANNAQADATKALNALGADYQEANAVSSKFAALVQEDTNIRAAFAAADSALKTELIGTEGVAGKTIEGALKAAADAQSQADKGVADAKTADDKAVAAQNTANANAKSITDMDAAYKAADADLEQHIHDCYAAFVAYTEAEIEAIFA